MKKNIIYIILLVVFSSNIYTNEIEELVLDFGLDYKEGNESYEKKLTKNFIDLKINYVKFIEDFLEVNISNLGNEDAIFYNLNVYNKTSLISKKEINFFEANSLKTYLINESLKDEEILFFSLVPKVRNSEENFQNNIFSFNPNEADSTDSWKVYNTNNSLITIINQENLNFNWRKSNIFNLSKDNVNLTFKMINDLEREVIFYILGDENVKLKVNNKLILETKKRNKPSISEFIFLKKGDLIEIYYSEKKGNAKLRVEFLKPCKQKSNMFEKSWSIKYCDLKNNFFINESKYNDSRLYFNWMKFPIVNNISKNIRIISSKRVELDNGTYNILLESKNNATLYINHKKVGNTYDLKVKHKRINKKRQTVYPKINLTKGIYNITIISDHKSGKALINFDLSLDKEERKYPFFNSYEPFNIKLDSKIIKEMKEDVNFDWNLFISNKIKGYFDNK